MKDGMLPVVLLFVVGFVGFLGFMMYFIAAKAKERKAGIQNLVNGDLSHWQYAETYDGKPDFFMVGVPEYARFVNCLTLDMEDIRILFCEYGYSNSGTIRHGETRPGMQASGESKNFRGELVDIHCPPEMVDEFRSVLDGNGCSQMAEGSALAIWNNKYHVETDRIILRSSSFLRKPAEISSFLGHLEKAAANRA